MESKALTSKLRYQAVFCPSCRNRHFNCATLSLHYQALVCPIRDRGQTFRITFDYQTGGLPFCDGANVSVGQFNQSSIEILFAICHGPGRRSAEPFKALGCLF
jgi:hypothetical protein